LAKTNADGTLVWNKTYTGEEDQIGCSVVEATSGGYVEVATHTPTTNMMNVTTFY
jgi:hypothetical protein